MLRLTILVTTAAVASALTGSASAEPFGAHVSMCAHELGARDNPPAVTCTHDGMTMTFPTFGAMVTRMRAMH